MEADGLGKYSDERFRMTFRISRETLKYILNRIREEIECNCTNHIEESIPPHARIIVAKIYFNLPSIYFIKARTLKMCLEYNYCVVANLITGDIFPPQKPQTTNGSLSDTEQIIFLLFQNSIFSQVNNSPHN